MQDFLKKYIYFLHFIKYFYKNTSLCLLKSFILSFKFADIKKM